MAVFLAFIELCGALLSSTLRLFLSKSESRSKMAASTKSLSVHRDADPTDNGIILDNQDKMVSIKIPDMFSSFLSVPPRINPLYREVKM